MNHPVTEPPLQYTAQHNPDSKGHGANMGPIWGRQDPGGPHVGPTNFTNWDWGRDKMAIIF